MKLLKYFLLGLQYSFCNFKLLWVYFNLVFAAANDNQSIREDYSLK